MIHEPNRTDRPASPVAHLVLDALNGRLSRREILRRSAALGLAAPMVAAMLRLAPSAHAQGTPVATPSGDPIILGGIFNLTGGMSSIDGPGSQGAQLAVNEINATGGVLGRPLELIVEDGRTDLTGVTNAVTRLIEEEEIAALLGINDTTFALAAATVAQESEIVFLTVGATGPVIPSTGEYIFMLPFGDNVQAAVGAEYAAEQGWTTCGLLVDDQLDFTIFLAEYFVDRFTADDIGGEILSELTFSFGDTDFSAQMTEFANLDPQPDFWYFSAAPNEAGTLVSQARAAGLTQPILSGDGFDTPLLIDLGGEAANGVVFATHQGIYDDSPAANEFNAAYEEEYGNPPETVFAALGYDGVRLMADAIERAGSTESAAIRDALADTEGFQGITGEVTYEEDQRIPTKGCALIEVQNGEFTFLRNVTPEQVPEA